MLKYLDEPPRSSRWVGQAVLAISLGLNALFIFHALEVRPIRADAPGLTPQQAAAALVEEEATMTHAPMEVCPPRDERRAAPPSEESVPPGLDASPRAPRAPLTTEVGVIALPENTRVQL